MTVETSLECLLRSSLCSFLMLDLDRTGKEESIASRFLNQHWQQRFYVLYGATNNSQGRLDYYEDAEAYRRDPKVRKTIYIEEIKEVRKTRSREYPYSLELHITREDQTQVHVFATESEKELTQWLNCINQVRKNDKIMKASSISKTDATIEYGSVMFDQNDIYESADDLQMYRVKVQETEAAKRCNLLLTTVYDLYVLPENIVLVEADHRILSWSYKHIRRYGCGESTFTFEAGRKSNSGEGLFSFTVPNGEQLFKAVQEQMKGMQKRHKGSFSDDISLQRDETPSLPVRNYTLGSGEESPSPTWGPEAGLFHGFSKSMDSQGQESKASPKVPAPNLPPKPKGAQKVPLGFASKAKSNEKKLDPMFVSPVPPHVDKSFQAELSSKLSGIQPPMLRRRGQSNTPPVSPPGVDRPVPRPYPPSPCPNNRVSTGERYELAKSKLPDGHAKPDSFNYMDVAEGMSLEPNYLRTIQKAAIPSSSSHVSTSPKNHDYAIYDITQSSQFRGRMSSDQEADSEDYRVYSEASLPRTQQAWKKCGTGDVMHTENYTKHPIYDDPAEPEPGATKMSDIIDKINMTQVTPSSSQYDHINIKQTARFFDADAPAGGNLYGQLNSKRHATSNHIGKHEDYYDSIEPRR